MAKSLSRMSSSAQLLMTGVILEGVNLLLCALALVPMADANLATTLLLLFLIVGGLGSSIAVVCAWWAWLSSAAFAGLISSCSWCLS